MYPLRSKFPFPKSWETIVGSYLKTIASPSDSAGRSASPCAGVPAEPSLCDVTVLGDGPGPPYWRLAYVPAAVHGSTRRTERQGPAGYSGRSAFRVCRALQLQLPNGRPKLPEMHCEPPKTPSPCENNKIRVKIPALIYICSIQKFADSNNYRSISEAEWLEENSLKI